MINNPVLPTSAKSVHSAAETHNDFIPLKAVVERHAHIVFRNSPPGDREEAAAAAIAFAFASFVNLKARGQDPVRSFPSMMARYAVLCVRDRRHTSSNDVMSAKAQRKHCFCVHSLTDPNGRQVRESSTRTGRKRLPDTFDEFLQDNTRTSPCEQAVFKIDFSNWLAARSQQDRQMIHELSLG